MGVGGGEVQGLVLLEYLHLRALDDGAKLRFIFIPPVIIALPPLPPRFPPWV